MNIALPILLLTFGGLTFWILTESKLKWYLKTACISAFCIFTIIFWSSIHSFLGWPALEKSLPEKVLIHWVIIKEPNKYTKFNGRIYFLAESVGESDSSWLARFFGYRKAGVEPRLYGVTYSRGLHERIEQDMRSKLRSGQPVVGRLTKGAKRLGRGPDGKGKSTNKGTGSESQEQEWQFHELLPSETHSKPER
jgi:hypothetical protein